MTIPYIRELAYAVNSAEGEVSPEAGVISSATINSITLTGGGEDGVLMNLGDGALKLEDTGGACIWSTDRQVSLAYGSSNAGVFNTAGTISTPCLTVETGAAALKCSNILYLGTDSDISRFLASDSVMTIPYNTPAVTLPSWAHSINGISDYYDIVNLYESSSFTVASPNANIICNGETMATSVVFETEGEVLGSCVRCWPVFLGDEKWIITNLSNNTMTVVTGPS